VTGWHEGPLAGFDLETTSADPESARIVTAAIAVRGGGREAETLTWLVNPGIDIPAEATAVHGVTTEMAQAGGADPGKAAEDISRKLTALTLDRIPLAIYNAPYDLTVLDRESRRHAITPFGDVLAGRTGCVIDPLVLDRHVDTYRKGSRTLAATCVFYRVTLDGAHNAEYDAIAAMRLAWKIAVAYPAIGSMTLAGLHDLQVRAKAAQSASLQDYLRRQGKPEVVDGSWPFRAYTGVAA
jgi:DNA polymerase-3 subunit epsilon